MDAFGLESYLFEPEYSEEELRHRENERSKQAEAITVDVDSDSDTANTSTSSTSDIESWCICACCSARGNERERVCCHGLFADKMSLNMGECVTNNPAFSQICLQPFSLELCFVQFLRYRKKDPKAAENMTNRAKTFNGL
ncbi:hypothetical protein HOLleu_02955 [Holothuria leucospilota]|uniref:P2X purinoreceptor 7 intracellular domain-containing protein n=1 Tax=Holothuria leucospilota TaxID=206669 RepID=A0A9Q1CQ89_HOLLE|nr:hypothetical protein HOLleu_02955 [Holothuria leucospilota]